MTAHTRFWNKVIKTSTCWVWTGYLQPNGYGRFASGGRSEPRVLVHRWAFAEANGWLPDELDHTCENRACVRPDHLVPTTRGDNVRRQTHFNASKTTCPAGHPYDRVRNTARGSERRCVTCDRANDRLRVARRRS